MKFALRAPILKYTLFGMLFLNSPAQASEPRSERMEKTAAEVIAADSAAIPKGWDNDCRASYKAGYEAGYRAGYLHGRRTATQPHSSGRASATRYADGSIVPTRDTTASGRRFMHRIGAPLIHLPDQPLRRRREPRRTAHRPLPLGTPPLLVPVPPRINPRPNLRRRLSGHRGRLLRLRKPRRTRKPDRRLPVPGRAHRTDQPAAVVQL